LDCEKEKEYKEVLEAYSEKSKEKALLVNRLIEVSRGRAHNSFFSKKRSCFTVISNILIVLLLKH
jgi:hypothetical protein